MAIPFDPKQVVPFEDLLISQVVQQEAPTKLLIERDIHQGGVFGDSKINQFRDEKK